jgi:rhamnosyltransferase
MKVAIIAHFSPTNTWNENFLEMLRVIENFFEKTFVITTSQRMSDLPNDLKKVNLVRRPNIGYDFYSYRVGVNLAVLEPNVEGIFLLNSSMLLLNEERFKKLLKNITKVNRTSAVRCLTASMQFGWHAQSYLLYFDLRYLPKKYFLNFFEKIEPTNSKYDLILRYEIGLSKSLKADKINCETMFQPSFLDYLIGAPLFMSSLIKIYGLRALLKYSFWFSWKYLNWTHFKADLLADRFGIVKAEFLRNNPHQLSQGHVLKSCSRKLRAGIEQLLTRERSHYRSNKNGLTEMIKQNDDLDILLQSIEGVRLRNANARVAVVAHLFYYDVFEEILNLLDNILEPFDLYITTPFEADIPKIIKDADRKKIAITVLLSRNKGRDVGPFVELFRKGYLDQYDSVLKLHTKKSLYSDKGELWRRELYKSLCGDTMKVMRILEIIRKQKYGLIGPAQYFLTNKKFMGGSRERLDLILRGCGVKYGSRELELGFFAGTMFWFNPKALKLIKNLPKEMLFFEEELEQRDKTLAHAFERIFCIIAQKEGYEIVDSDNYKKLDPNDKAHLKNNVPVL